MKKKIGIIDYEVGNIGSLSNAISFLGHEPMLVNNPKRIINFDRLILPGVGHFSTAMIKLQDHGFVSYLLEYLKDNSKKLLGICLGMQLLGTFSEEGNTKGLSLLDFDIKKLRNKNINNNFKIPNIGWRSVKKINNSLLLDEIKNDDFYFVHSYAAHSTNKDIIISKTNYCEEFISIVEKKNIFGVQFHPEKSDKAGLKLLKNFIEKIN